MFTKIIARIQTALLYPAARLIIGAQSALQWLRTMNKSPRVWYERDYDGRPILLLALYEKGVLRPDILRLLASARAQGLYILAINTLKLTDPEALKDQIDCYIERPNYGRDFGSYKSGFLHFYGRGWDKTCPRVVMVNDSVYYSTRGLDAFLADLSRTQTEVLGATENYYMEYHLGSFCVSMAQSVLQNARLKAYWKDYKLTDIRPIVIRRGEMKLSKTLKRCVSSPDQFNSLFSAPRFMREVSSNVELQDVVIRDARTSELHAGPGFSIGDVQEALSGRFVQRRYGSNEEGKEMRVDAPLAELFRADMVIDRKTLRDHLLRHFDVGNDERVEELVSDAIASAGVQRFLRGSQIHQNATVLLYMGLPIIKMDSVFRGVLNLYDVIRLQKLLVPVEAEKVGKALIDRPFGDLTLVGWKRAAFNLGLL